jgi:hypothetical protein
MVDLVYHNKITMNKSNHFSGQLTFAQLIKLLPKDLIAGCIQRTNADHYYKKFNTWHHLITMLFTCYGHCHSLREVVTGMRAFEGRLQSCGIRFFPARSTFSEANANRDSGVFEEIFLSLKSYWDAVYPDSRSNRKSVYIIDSTTIKLFQDIFKGSGLSKKNGKRKGGLKVHMAVQQSQCIPSVIHLSAAASHDITFAKQLAVLPGSTVIMDRGYRSYPQYQKWNQKKVRWITRLHPQSYYQVTETLKVSEKQKNKGVKSDHLILMGAPFKKIKVACRLIKLISPDSGKTWEFITNDLKSAPSYIAALYKKRWSIELLFKRLKQNMPLQYFLGDNQNAIKIQVWCALIADLLLQVVKKQVNRKWAFSNIVSIVRLHLFNYLNLLSFLENPERSIITTTKEDLQLKLNLTG